MRYVIVDLEATCWEQRQSRPMEITEIGAVLMAGSTGPVEREFASFVRPVVEPRLSAFCRQLTSIRQEEIDTADIFPDVFGRFIDWSWRR